MMGRKYMLSRGLTYFPSGGGGDKRSNEIVVHDEFTSRAIIYS